MKAYVYKSEKTHSPYGHLQLKASVDKPEEGYFKLNHASPMQPLAWVEHYDLAVIKYEKDQEDIRNSIIIASEEWRNWYHSSNAYQWGEIGLYTEGEHFVIKEVAEVCIDCPNSKHPCEEGCSKLVKKAYPIEEPQRADLRGGREPSFGEYVGKILDREEKLSENEALKSKISMAQEGASKIKNHISSNPSAADIHWILKEIMYLEQLLK